MSQSQSVPAETDQTHGWLLATEVRQKAFGTALMLLIVSILLWNLPDGLGRSTFRDPTRPVFQVARIDQQWDYFAPEVVLVSNDVSVRIHHADGSASRWDFKDDLGLLRPFRRGRWSKIEQSAADPERWNDVLNFVGRSVADDPTVVRLELVITSTPPTLGDHGPYDQTPSDEIVATRNLEPTS